jgi:predicted transposase YbfD/YdcC
LKGIQNAQFRYFDGTAWSSQWDSRKQKGYPVAVAVQFDFPSRSKARRDRVQSKIETNSSIEAEVSSEQSFGSIDTLLSQQSTAQTEAADSQDYLITTANTEVTIVVATHFRPANWKREEAESAIRDDARSNRKNSSRSSP